MPGVGAVGTILPMRTAFGVAVTALGLDQLGPFNSMERIIEWTLEATSMTRIDHQTLGEWQRSLGIEFTHAWGWCRLRLLRSAKAMPSD